MTKTMLLLGAALAVVPAISPAKDYPLEFKTLTAREAMSFPGGSGISAQVEISKLAGIVKEPPAASKQPLYGELGRGTNAMAFRLDESRGNGKGYDQLIVDLNRNGDLADDPVIATVAETGTTRADPLGRKLFGPIQVPDAKKISDGQPVCFAELYLYSATVNAGVTTPVSGRLQMKAGWYLETTAEFDGVRRKVGLADGNCNNRLGDISTPTTYVNLGETNWYFQGGDTFLQDVNDSGTFQNSSTAQENFPFFPMIHVGSKPYKIALSADARTLSVESWSGPMAELSIQPHGTQVASIQVALENAPGQWQLMHAEVTDGKTRVPPGNCRLYACTVKEKTAAGGLLILNGTKRQVSDAIPCPAGAATPFKCGAPLEAKVTSMRVVNSGSLPVAESNTLLGRLIRSAAQPADKEPLQQRIEARLMGAGGEIYSGFRLLDKNDRTVDLPQPVLTIADPGGKELYSTKMRYG